MNELSVVQYLNQLGQGTFVDSVTKFVSLIPFLIILWLCLSLIAGFRDKINSWFVLLTVVIAIALHFVISEGLFKHAILTLFDPRTRPYLIGGSGINPIGTPFTDSSFPSSHMASTAAALTVFVGYYRKALVPAVIFILLMAFARLHNGMHFPSDVLVGTILGILYGLVALLIVKKNRKPKPTPASDAVPTASSQ